MKKITLLITFLMTIISFNVNAQYGCATGVSITNGYTVSGITTPGTGGAEDWNAPNPTSSCSSYSGYWDDDVYMFTYTAGGTDEEISMTTFTREGWNGLGVFTTCSGTALDDCIDSATTSSSNVSLTVTASISAGQTVYIATGQYGTPNNLDFDVTAFTATPLTNPPNCDTTVDAALVSPVSGTVSWSAATGNPTGYFMSVGSATGLSDILANTDVSDVISYDVTGLSEGTTYYTTITPYNGNGNATGCAEQTFTTSTPIANDTIAGAIPITPSDEGTGCSSAGFTLPFATDGTTDSGLDNTCNNTDTGLDQFFTWTATSDGLLWNDASPGNPGITIRDASGTQIICAQTYAADDIVLSGWTIGDDLIIQIYDYGTSVSDVAFCLEEFTLPTAPLCAESLTPTDGTIDVVVSGGSIDISWVAPSSGVTPTGYNIWFGTTSGSLTNIGTTDGTTFTTNITGIEYSTIYYWSVVPTNGGSPALGCSELSFETEAAPPAPANDDCADATLVDGALPYSDTVDASAATNNAGFISECGSGMNDGVWYTFTPITGGTVDIAVTGVTGWDPELAIYSGSCGTFTCEDSADSGGTGGNETLTGVTVVAGTQYFINIGHYSGTTNNSEGPFTIDISTSDTVGLSVEDNVIEGFSLYPNPVNDRLHLTALDNIDELSVYNLLGQEVLRTQPKVLSTQVDMSNLPTGMYVVKVKVGQQLGSYRIVKE